MTPQRTQVVQIFLHADGHLSSQELYELVKLEDPHIGLATVFRTLKTLTDCRLAREVFLSDGRTRFERLYKRPHHHHLVCVECDRTIEFSSPQLEQIQEEIVAKYRFVARQHNLQIQGICPDCQKHRKPVQSDFDSDLVFARDALRIAMETERRGINFYGTASRIVRHRSTRSTFLEMLEDEKKHFRELEREWKKLIRKAPKVLDAPEFLHFDYDALEKIFPSREETRRKLSEDLSEIEALKLAMGMERDAHLFFREYAEKFEDTRGRDVFLKFADEEEEHYELIKEALDRLTP